ncbi:MAG TPA: phytanoyl-CoA dioxygenase family protein [Epsilonproteobacteria bacterium]|nr:phytanoyl-CoA dioxygenase family protein [Campylobacterota bacterium]
MVLTSQQLAQFKKDGFLLLPRFAPKLQCKKILDIAKVHLKYRIEPIETEDGYHAKDKDVRANATNYHSLAHESKAPIRRLRQVYDRDIVFREWMEDENIRPILEEILDDQVVLTTAHHNSIMTKLAQVGTPTLWHQDRRYWHYSDDNLVSVWLALGKEHKDNGVLEFIPGSHTMQFKSYQFDDKDYFKNDHPLNVPLIKNKVSLKLQRGDVVIFHSLLLHQAGANTTNKPKISFVYTVKGSRTQAIQNTRSSAYLEIPLPLTNTTRLDKVTNR